MYARFYKRVDAVDREGHPRRYAAFVAVAPDPVVRPTTGVTGIWPAFLVVLGAMGLLTIWLVRRAVRPGAALRARGPGPDPDAEVDAGPALPDDPIDALTELRRRAEPPERE
jgi:hypothetical protein